MYKSSRLSKVIDLGANRKRISEKLIVAYFDRMINTVALKWQPSFPRSDNTTTSQRHDNITTQQHHNSFKTSGRSSTRKPREAAALIDSWRSRSDRDSFVKCALQRRIFSKSDGGLTIPRPFMQSRRPVVTSLAAQRASDCIGLSKLAPAPVNKVGIAWQLVSYFLSVRTRKPSWRCQTRAT